MPVPPADGLGRLARPGGAFAMIALDQRESLRTMLRPRHDGDVPDEALPAFKIDAARALTPHASAVLLDVDTGLGAVRDADVIAPGCGLIVAADTLTQEPGGVVEETATDEAVLADDAVAAVADAYKLLVIWRPEGDRVVRRATVESFLRGCRRRGRPGIVEGIVRTSGEVPPGEHADLVVEAGGELAGYGADLYKAEVPTLGRTGDDEITDGARRLTDALPCPWVVLSNGTSADRFDAAVLAACRGGASGFLAGRAIWLASIAADDVRGDLESVAAPRLAGLAASVDGVARPWWEH